MRITGNLRYEGAEIVLDDSRHNLAVVLSASYPSLQTLLGEAQVLYPASRLEGGIAPFELRSIRPGRYHLWASIFESDQRNEDVRALLALGAPGGVCALRDPEGMVEVGDVDLELDEIQIYDDGGAQDPCHADAPDGGIGDGGQAQAPPFGRPCFIDVADSQDERSGSSPDCDPVAPRCVLPSEDSDDGVCTRDCADDPSICDSPTSCIDTSNFTDEPNAPSLCLDVAALLGG